MVGGDPSGAPGTLQADDQGQGYVIHVSLFFILELQCYTHIRLELRICCAHAN